MQYQSFKNAASGSGAVSSQLEWPTLSLQPPIVQNTQIHQSAIATTQRGGQSFGNGGGENSPPKEDDELIQNPYGMQRIQSFQQRSNPVQHVQQHPEPREINQIESHNQPPSMNIASPRNSPPKEHSELIQNPFGMQRLQSFQQRAQPPAMESHSGHAEELQQLTGPQHQIDSHQTQSTTRNAQQHSEGRSSAFKPLAFVIFSFLLNQMKLS